MKNVSKHQHDAGIYGRHKSVVNTEATGVRPSLKPHGERLLTTAAYVSWSLQYVLFFRGRKIHWFYFKDLPL